MKFKNSISQKSFDVVIEDLNQSEIKALEAELKKLDKERQRAYLSDLELLSVIEYNFSFG